MSFTSQILADIYDHIYKPSKEDGRYVWIQQTAHDGKPWGHGQLHTDAATLVAQIEAASKVKGAVHLCVSAQADYTEDSKRSALRSDYAAGIVLDIDFKDHSIPANEVMELLDKIDPIPTLIADTANGVHVYYLFEENIIRMFGSVHRSLAAFYGEQGVRVDPAHSSPKTTIRSIGSTGKSGDMIVGTNGVFGGPKYTLDSLAAAMGLTEFDEDPVGENLGYTDVLFSLHPQVSRQQLLHTCGAMAQFEKDAETQFQKGAVSGWHDARMYSSQIAHTWLEGHFDITDMNERRDHAMRIMSEWPEHNQHKADALYASVLNTPAFHCDKWAHDQYVSQCDKCRYGDANQRRLTSPIQNAINDEALGHIPNRIPVEGEDEDDGEPDFSGTVVQPIPNNVIKPPQGTPASLSVTNPALSETIPKELRLPDSYFIGAAGTLFIKLPPPPDDPDGDEKIKPISQPSWVLDVRNMRQQFISGLPLLDGYEGHIVGTGKGIDFRNDSLNFPNDLNKDLAAAGIEVFDAKLARTYFGRQIAAGLVMDRPFVERLGWHRDDEKEHVFYQLGVAIKENEVTACEPRGSLRTHFIGTNGDTSDVAPRGDVTRWRDKCLTPFVQDPALSQHMLLILSAFTAPLYGVTGNESGPLLNFYGDTTTGKTTALCIANSVFSPPTRHLINARDTTTSLFNKIGLVQSLPVTLDEASTLKEDVMYDLCYQMTGGRDKSAMTGGPNGSFQLRQTNDWNTCVISTANNSARSLVSRLAKDNEAVYVRTIDIWIPSGDDVCNQKNRLLMSEAIEVAEDNFGCVGMMYVQEVMRNRAAIANAYDHMHAQALYAGSGRFLERHFALVKVAASLLVKLNLIRQTDLQHISDTLLLTAAGSQEVKEVIIDAATPLYSDFLLELNSFAVPIDRTEFIKNYKPRIAPNTPTPAMNRSVWEDSKNFYCTTGFVSRYHSENHSSYTRAQMIDEFNRQIAVHGLDDMKQIGARRVPVIDGPVMNSGDDVSSKLQRLYQIPKV